MSWSLPEEALVAFSASRGLRRRAGGRSHRDYNGTSVAILAHIPPVWHVAEECLWTTMMRSSFGVGVVQIVAYTMPSYLSLGLSGCYFTIGDYQDCLELSIEAYHPCNCFFQRASR